MLTTTSNETASSVGVGNVASASFSRNPGRGYWPTGTEWAKLAGTFAISSAIFLIGRLGYRKAHSLWTKSGVALATPATIFLLCALVYRHIALSRRNVNYRVKRLHLMQEDRQLHLIDEWKEAKANYFEATLAEKEAKLTEVKAWSEYTYANSKVLKAEVDLRHVVAKNLSQRCREYSKIRNKANQKVGEVERRLKNSKTKVYNVEEVTQVNRNYENAISREVIMMGNLYMAENEYNQLNLQLENAQATPARDIVTLKELVNTSRQTMEQAKQTYKDCIANRDAATIDVKNMITTLRCGKIKAKSVGATEEGGATFNAALQVVEVSGENEQQAGASPEVHVDSRSALGEEPIPAAVSVHIPKIVVLDENGEQLDGTQYVGSSVPVSIYRDGQVDDGDMSEEEEELSQQYVRGSVPTDGQVDARATSDETAQQNFAVGGAYARPPQRMYYAAHSENYQARNSAKRWQY